MMSVLKKKLSAHVVVRSLYPNYDDVIKAQKVLVDENSKLKENWEKIKAEIKDLMSICSSAENTMAVTALRSVLEIMEEIERD